MSRSRSRNRRIRASQLGDASTRTRRAVDRSFIAESGHMTVSADDKAKVLRCSLCDFGLPVTVALSTATRLTCERQSFFSIGTTAVQVAALGLISITPVLGTLTATNYIFSSSMANLLSPKPDSQLRPTTPARILRSLSGIHCRLHWLVNSDNECPLSGVRLSAPPRVATSPEGNYPINVAIGTVEFPQLQFFVRQRHFDIYSPACAFLDDFSRTMIPALCPLGCSVE